MLRMGARPGESPRWSRPAPVVFSLSHCLPLALILATPGTLVCTRVLCKARNPHLRSLKTPGPGSYIRRGHLPLQPRPSLPAVPSLMAPPFTSVLTSSRLALDLPTSSPRPGEEGPASALPQGRTQSLMCTLTPTRKAWTQPSLRELSPRSSPPVWYPACLGTPCSPPPTGGPLCPHPCSKQLFPAH